jgi:hypothetical protein
MKLRQNLFYRSFLKGVDLFVHQVSDWKAFNGRTISKTKEKRAKFKKIAPKCPDNFKLKTGPGYFSPIKPVIKNCIKVVPSIVQIGQLQIIKKSCKLPTNKSNNNNISTA